MELDASGKVEKRYIRGNDRGYGSNLVYADKGDNTEKQYYVTDPHGNVVQLTDEQGKVIKTYEYDSFGNEVNPDSKDENPFRYCGEYYDKETEEVYLRARYYEPEVGRFLTRDTYTGEEEEPESLHLYAYCGNDGVNMVDPSGHDAYSDVKNYLNGNSTDSHVKRALKKLKKKYKKCPGWKFKKYTPKKYNKYDNYIKGWVVYFKKYKIKKQIDPGVIKAMMYQESRMGMGDDPQVNSNVKNDVMQCLDPRNPPVYEFANINPRGGDIIVVPSKKNADGSVSHYKPLSQIDKFLIGKPTGTHYFKVAKRLFAKIKNGKYKGKYKYQRKKATSILSIGLGTYWYGIQLKKYKDKWIAAQKYNVGTSSYKSDVKKIYGTGKK